MPELAGADPAVSLQPAVDQGWSDGYAAANDVPERWRRTHHRMLESIQLPTAFATLREEGEDLARGLAVLDRGMVGLFDIVTLPAARRRGAARRLVGALLDWGRAQGASGAYLQVVAANAPAIPLYEQFGYREAYRYHYRVGS